MAYSCKDCSYRGKVAGQAGECPACGSFNMVRGTGSKEAAPAGKKWRMAVLLLLWGFLAVLLIGKLAG